MYVCGCECEYVCVYVLLSYLYPTLDYKLHERFFSLFTILSLELK